MQTTILGLQSPECLDTYAGTLPSNSRQYENRSSTTAATAHMPHNLRQTALRSPLQLSKTGPSTWRWILKWGSLHSPLAPSYNGIQYWKILNTRASLCSEDQHTASYNIQHPQHTASTTHSTLCAVGLLPILTALEQDEINNKPMGLFQWLHPEVAYE